MGKAEVGTPKYLANKMKSKGLQKLRWYCQMCQKQCRDENGFKCHTMSESHQRQLLLFADTPDKFLGDFSKDFENGYMNLLKRAHNTKRVYANMVYQEYIREKDHVHMNATQWETLSAFVQYLGKTGKCTVDRTEKGWYVAWIDRDPETIARQEALAKKDKMAKDDEERMAEFISKQVEKGSAAGSSVEQKEYAEFIRLNEDEKISLSLKTTAKPAEKMGPPLSTKPLLSSRPSSSAASSSSSSGSCSSGEGSRNRKEEKRKKSALDEIMEAELAHKKKQKLEHHKEGERKREDDEQERPWLKKGIVVKIVTKSLGDKYYKQKGYVKEVVGADRMGAVVVLNSNGCKMKLDQSHLETVVPAVDRSVLVLAGKHRGREAVLRELDVDNFCAKLKLVETGEKIKLPYEHFSKLHESRGS